MDESTCPRFRPFKEFLPIGLTGVLHFMATLLLIASPQALAGNSSCLLHTSIALSDEERSLLQQRLFSLAAESPSTEPGDLVLVENSNEQSLNLRVFVRGTQGQPGQWISLWSGKYGKSSSLMKFWQSSSRVKMMEELPACANLNDRIRWQSYFQIVGPLARKRVNRSYQTSEKQQGLTELITLAEAIIQYGPQGQDYEKARAYYQNQMDRIALELKTAAAQSESIDFEGQLNDVRKALMPHLKSYCSGSATAEQKKDPQYKPLLQDSPYLLSSFWGPDKCGNCVARALMTVGLFNDHRFLQEEGPWQLGVQLFEDHVQTVFWNPQENKVIDIVSGQKVTGVRGSIYSPELISFAMALRSELASDRERDSGFMIRMIDPREISISPLLLRLFEIHDNPGDWHNRPFGYLKFNHGLSYNSTTPPPARAENEFQEIQDFDQPQAATQTKPSEKKTDPSPDPLPEALIAHLDEAVNKEKRPQAAAKKEALEKLVSDLSNGPEQQAAQTLLNKVNHSDLTPEAIAQLKKSFAENSPRAALLSRCFNNCRVLVESAQVRVARPDEQSQFLPKMKVFIENKSDLTTPSVQKKDEMVRLTPQVRLVFRSAEDMSQYLVSHLEDSTESMIGDALQMAKKAASTRPYREMVEKVGHFHAVASLSPQEAAEQLKMLKLVTRYLGLARQLDEEVFFTSRWNYHAHDPEMAFPSTVNDQLLMTMRAAQDQLNSETSFKNLDLLSSEQVIETFKFYSSVARELQQIPQDSRGARVSYDALTFAPISPSLGIIRYLLINKTKLDSSLRPARLIQPDQIVLKEVDEPGKIRRVWHPIEQDEYKKGADLQKNPDIKVSPEWIAGLFMSLSPLELQHPLVQWAAAKYWDKDVQDAYRKYLSATHQESFRILWSWGSAQTLNQAPELEIESPWRHTALSLTITWNDGEEYRSKSDVRLPDPRQPIPDFIQSDLEKAIRERFGASLRFNWGRGRVFAPLLPQEALLTQRLLANKDEFLRKARSLFSQHELDRFVGTRPELMMFWSQGQFVLKDPGSSRLEIYSIEYLMAPELGRAVLYLTDQTKAGNDRFIEASYGPAG